MQLQANDTIFHNWKVNKVIGAGSFGTVYEIEREEFGRVYKSAAKVITIPDDSNDGLQIAREGMTEENTVDYYKSLVEDIINECDMMERMKGDSHIVSFEDHYVEEHENGKQWTIYIRMELLKPLISFITDENNFLKRDQIIGIGIDICKGLEVCQQYNVVHRDIKLENIFVSDTGKYKLGDFGISKVMEQSELAVSQKGTKLYMAPEMFCGGKYDATVDIYSLGLVLYRLLNNNRAPFMPDYPQRIHIQDKEIALQRRLSGESLPAPCNADEAISSIVKKACSFDPKERYQTPEEMRKALESLSTHSEETCAVDSNMMDSSKTLHVHDVLGQYTLQKRNHGINRNQRTGKKYETNQKHRTVRRVTGVAIAILIFSWICMTGIRNYQENLAKNIRAGLMWRDGVLFGSILSEDIPEITEKGIAAAESALDKYWMVVPQLLNEEEKKAIEILLEAGYEEKQIEITYEYSNDVDSGLVMYQSLKSFSQVRKGTGIAITVSLGRKTVVITNQKTKDSDSGVTWKELE